MSHRGEAPLWAEDASKGNAAGRRRAKAGITGGFGEAAV